MCLCCWDRNSSLCGAGWSWWHDRTLPLTLSVTKTEWLTRQLPLCAFFCHYSSCLVSIVQPLPPLFVHSSFLWLCRRVRFSCDTFRPLGRIQIKELLSLNLTLISTVFRCVRALLVLLSCEWGQPVIVFGNWRADARRKSCEPFNLDQPTHIEVLSCTWREQRCAGW